jgi:zinc/manganese transport system substrate-binding protein
MVAKELSVVTTTSTLKALVQEIVTPNIKIESISQGHQDPHYLEAKPSYIVKLAKADLLISVGLELEVGWLPNLLLASKNPKIQKGQPHYIETSDFIEVLERSQRKVDRSSGDLHPQGNPHYLLDPLRASEILHHLAQRLSTLDPENAQSFLEQSKKFSIKMKKLIEKTHSDLKALTPRRPVITQHRMLVYLLDRFNIPSLGEIENKPGIPPSASHLLSLIQRSKVQPSPCLLIDSFSETSAAKRIQREIPQSKILIIPSEVNSMPNTETYPLFIEQVLSILKLCQTKP